MEKRNTVRKISRKRLLVIIALISILALLIFLLALRIDFGKREDEVLNYFATQEGMPETFAQLENLTSPDAIILCWWDYGRAVKQWSHREVIEAYPSRDIWHSTGASRDPFHNFEAQLFGTWGSSEKIHDIAKMFMLPEAQSLLLMKNYNVSYVLVFTPDELQKFYWIAQIAGYNGSEYLTVENGNYKPTEKAQQVTLLRLIFDEQMPPIHFTKIYDNGRGKIYEVNY
ncbi:MAG: hypothetical protein QXF44_01250 [Candidatus Bathyarchaeia archaeon]